MTSKTRPTEVVHLTPAGRRVAVRLLLLAGAIVVATCVTLGAAGLVHMLLVALIGQEGISARDDALPMLALVGGCYALGALAGLATFLLGYRRFVRNRPARDIHER